MLASVRTFINISDMVSRKKKDVRNRQGRFQNASRVFSNASFLPFESFLAKVFAEAVFAVGKV